MSHSQRHMLFHFILMVIESERSFYGDISYIHIHQRPSNFIGKQVTAFESITNSSVWINHLWEWTARWCWSQITESGLETIWGTYNCIWTTTSTTSNDGAGEKVGGLGICDGAGEYVTLSIQSKYSGASKPSRTQTHCWIQSYPKLTRAATPGKTAEAHSSPLGVKEKGSTRHRNRWEERFVNKLYNEPSLDLFWHGTYHEMTPTCTSSSGVSPGSMIGPPLSPGESTRAWRQTLGNRR